PNVGDHCSGTSFVVHRGPTYNGRAHAIYGGRVRRDPGIHNRAMSGGPVLDRAELAMDVVTGVGELDAFECAAQDFFRHDSLRDFRSRYVDIRTGRRVSRDQRRTLEGIVVRTAT